MWRDVRKYPGKQFATNEKARKVTLTSTRYSVSKSEQIEIAKRWATQNPWANHEFKKLMYFLYRANR